MYHEGCAVTEFKKILNSQLTFQSLAVSPLSGVWHHSTSSLPKLSSREVRTHRCMQNNGITWRNLTIAASGYNSQWMTPCQAWLNMKPPSLLTFSRPWAAVLGLHPLTPLTYVQLTASALCKPVSWEGWVLSHIRILMMETISLWSIDLLELADTAVSYRSMVYILYIYWRLHRT